MADRQTSSDHQVLDSHFVYIVQCANGTLYTGYTTNVARRIATHNAGKGARYTRMHLPVTLLASWSFPTKSQALRVEYAIKRLTRSRKLHLIQQASLGLPLDPGINRKMEESG